MKKIRVTFGDILDSGCWMSFCDTYRINEWCINEGRADRDDTHMISIKDANRWGLLSDDKDTENNTFKFSKVKDNDDFNRDFLTETAHDFQIDQELILKFVEVIMNWKDKVVECEIQMREDGKNEW